MIRVELENLIDPIEISPLDPTKHHHKKSYFQPNKKLAVASPKSQDTLRQPREKKHTYILWKSKDQFKK